ncbi:MAG: ATP synthase F1 subunit gamma [Candidatus Levybacteria bacterium RIFCSPLOWO2_01_FULL_36_13]|nr:MAG: ATP synthase F1 subunit gamma [Candidatus Levybacteria bacterium RIFCSPHIGHO2_01_FULL_36_15b]OGH35577.1 MAG: ATP synthase F1 subunit gamma [Candidatus Levybacteria bacterium RIFCSPLOWO2_01_FULL_36_13]
MATLLTLKRRIKTTKNVSKTTKAMQMIAASKLKRAQDSAVQALPYTEKLTELSKNISRILEAGEISSYTLKPKANSKLVIVISPDKGLSGGLVTNLIKEVLNEDSKMKIYYIAVGKKAENYLTSLGKDVIATFPFGTAIPAFDLVFPILKMVDDYFLFGKVSVVEIITTKFLNVFTQIPQRQILLPVRLAEEKSSSSDILFEPSADELLPDLLRHYLEVSMYQGLLESYASEQAARMIAMKNATDNANEIIDVLTLSYNKSRQEKITNELLDIGGGIFYEQ